MYVEEGEDALIDQPLVAFELLHPAGKLPAVVPKFSFNKVTWENKN